MKENPGTSKNKLRTTNKQQRTSYPNWQQITKTKQNQQRTDKILHQTGSMISLSSVNNAKTSSPYVMYSLDPAIQYQEDSSMNPMLNFANRRVSTATSGSTQSIYSQLQFPSTSNFGSMKRKKKFDSSAKKNHQKEEANYATDSTEYSTDVTGDNIDFTEQEYTDNNVKIWSLQYVPQVFSIAKKTVKVWMNLF